MLGWPEELLEVVDGAGLGWRMVGRGSVGGRNKHSGGRAEGGARLWPWGERFPGGRLCLTYTEGQRWVLGQGGRCWVLDSRGPSWVDCMEPYFPGPGVQLSAIPGG